MTSPKPKIMALQEIEPPGALAEALGGDFLRPLRIENPPPVQLMPLDNWGGFCHTQDLTQEGEVVLASQPLGNEVERFRGTYLHEITHRFLSGYQEKEIGGSHGPVFFALQLLLYLRAGERACGRPWFFRANVYDLQDAWLEKDYSPGQALDWACKQAEDLAEDQAISAESAGAEISLRFSSWRAALAAAPAKRRAAAAARVAQEQALTRKISAARWWSCYIGMLGLLLGFWVGFLAT